MAPSLRTKSSTDKVHGADGVDGAALVEAGFAGGGSSSRLRLSEPSFSRRTILVYRAILTLLTCRLRCRRSKSNDWRDNHGRVVTISPVFRSLAFKPASSTAPFVRVASKPLDRKSTRL